MKWFITRFENIEDYNQTIRTLSENGYFGDRIALGSFLPDNYHINDINKLSLLKTDFHYINKTKTKINENKYIYLSGLKEIVTGLVIAYENRENIKNDYKYLLGKDNINVSLQTINDDLDGDTSELVIEPKNILNIINKWK